MPRLLGNPVPIGKITGADVLADKLHIFVVSGNYKETKKLLKKHNVTVDSPNSLGQTALFCAAYLGHKTIVELLLSYGANPNHRCSGSYTPVHGACWCGNIEVLVNLITAGGDMRLHDSLDRTPRDWALLQPHAAQCQEMKSFIDSNQENACKFRNSWTSSSSHCNPKFSFRHKGNKKNAKSFLKSFGYGMFHEDETGDLYALTFLPSISKDELQKIHGFELMVYSNGAFTVMERMVWKNTEITLRRLKESSPKSAADLLITEYENISKLHHPCILHLVGYCPVNNFEGMSLIFECIRVGSLYNYLHEQKRSLLFYMKLEILLQICEALIYLQDRGFYHCSVTSHAVQLLGHSFAKLSNFEYMVSRKQIEERNSKTKAIRNIHPQSTYNWLPSEIMKYEIPCSKSDIYSFSCLIWELSLGEVPWSALSADDIRRFVAIEKKSLFIPDELHPSFIQILKLGLRNDFIARKIELMEIRTILRNTLQVAFLPNPKEVEAEIPSSEKLYIGGGKVIKEKFVGQSSPDVPQRPLGISQKDFREGYKRNLKESNYSHSASPRTSLSAETSHRFINSYTSSESQRPRRISNIPVCKHGKKRKVTPLQKKPETVNLLYSPSKSQSFNLASEPSKSLSMKEKTMMSEPQIDYNTGPRRSYFLRRRRSSNKRAQNSSKSLPINEKSKVSINEHSSKSTRSFLRRNKSSGYNLRTMQKESLHSEIIPQVVNSDSRYSGQPPAVRVSSTPVHSPKMNWTPEEEKLFHSRCAQLCSEILTSHGYRLPNYHSTDSSIIKSPVDNEEQDLLQTSCSRCGKPIEGIQSDPVNTSSELNCSNNNVCYSIQSSPTILKNGQKKLHEPLEVTEVDIHPRPSTSNPFSTDENSDFNKFDSAQLCSLYTTENEGSPDSEGVAFEKESLETTRNVFTEMNSQYPCTNPFAVYEKRRNGSVCRHLSFSDNTDEVDLQETALEKKSSASSLSEVSQSSLRHSRSNPFSSYERSRENISDSDQHHSSLVDRMERLDLSNGRAVKVIEVKAEPGYSCTVRTESQSNSKGDGTHHVILTKTHLESGDEEVLEEVIQAESIQHRIIVDKPT